MSRDQVKGASKSLNKTIADLEAYLADDEVGSPSELRARMNEKIGDIAAWWFQEGVRCGHRGAFEALRDNGEIPPTLVYDYGNAWLSPSCERTLVAKSRIRRV